MLKTFLHMKSPIKTGIIVCFFVLTSCYESLDFNQLDNFVSKPVFTFSLNYFSLVPSQFFSPSGVQESTISDVTNLEIFQYDNSTIDIVKLDFNAEIKNDFDREVTISVEFLDNENRVVHTLNSMTVTSKNLIYKYFEEIEIASNPDLLNSIKVKISIELEDTGTSLDPNDTSEFEFKSAVTLYIESSL